jgi:hypothetical protein
MKEEWNSVARALEEKTRAFKSVRERFWLLLHEGDLLIRKYGLTKPEHMGAVRLVEPGSASGYSVP